jgi:hypothetical protein
MHCGADERKRLIDWLWAGDFSDCTTEILEQNPELAEFIDERTTVARLPTEPRAKAAALRRRRTRHNFLAGVLARNRSRDFVPRHQLLLSIEAHASQMNVRFWDMLSSVRVLLSRNWVHDLITEAMQSYPGCSYEQLDWVSAAVFDNYTTNFNYDARHTQETHGCKIDMTNWTTIFLPKATLPHVDLGILPGATPLQQAFKHGFNMESVVTLCTPDHPDLVLFRRDRWRGSFEAIRERSYFHRPAYQPPQAHECFWQEPMPGVLQSSYADVEFELDKVRGHDMHKDSKFLFIGGDGLAINRINHTLARKWGQYLNQYPVVIPVQGEHPHGTAHVLHMGWRPFWPMLQTILRGIDHSECVRDWAVSDYNDHDHAMCIVIEGVAQYFLHLDSLGGGPDIDDLGPFNTACAINTDLEWLVRFLSDFGFLYWSFRQAVRSNDSATIDLVWRECISFMHTSESNKTQYAPMAVLRVFWSEALSPPLASIYHKNRTLSMLGLPGSNAGWDMWQEKGNLSIAMNVVRPSQERIAKYMYELNFTGAVSKNLTKELMGQRKVAAAKMVKISNDVQLVVDFLCDKLGSSWAQALTPRQHRHARIITPPKSPRPWEAVERGKAELPNWVRGHLQSKVMWPMP